MPRISMLVALLAVIVFLFESLSPTSAATGDATLRLGFKPCEPKDASCHNAEVFVKDSFTVAVEMKTFHIPNGLGYDAWEADVCFPRNELAFSRLTFEGGPQGKQVSFGPTPVDATDDCMTLGAAVGPGEGASQDFGNLANLDFTCKRASEDIELELTSGLVILGNNDSKEVAQGPAQVVVDCGAGSMSAIASGGFLTELVDENDPYAGVQIHAKAGEKFEVAISIDELTNLADKDNPGDGGGYTDVMATLNYDQGAVAVHDKDGPIAAALVPCTANADDKATVTPGFGTITVSCPSEKGPTVSDENQSLGPVFTVVFVCDPFLFGSTKTEIVAKGLSVDDENNSTLHVFNRSAPIFIECIGVDNNKDGDSCTNEAEATINEMSQALVGLNYMDPSVYDYPDINGSGTVTVGDVLAYVRNFGRNNPTVPPPTGLGPLSDPPASVHDVSQPNNDQIGSDDILRTVLLFGIPCP